VQTNTVRGARGQRTRVRILITLNRAREFTPSCGNRRPNGSLVLSETRVPLDEFLAVGTRVRGREFEAAQSTYLLCNIISPSADPAIRSRKPINFRDLCIPIGIRWKYQSAAVEPSDEANEFGWTD
jgi:hypothetical protein